MKDYIAKLREKIGQDKFIHPAARIIIENELGEILFIERNDNGKIGLPAGGLEEGETIRECIIREVKEETGLILLDASVIGIITDPRKETVTYPNGDVVQYFTIEFYSNQWSGEVAVEDTDEIRSAKFMPASFLEQLMPNEKSIIKSLEMYRCGEGLHLD